MSHRVQWGTGSMDPPVNPTDKSKTMEWRSCWGQWNSSSTSLPFIQKTWVQGLVFINFAPLFPWLITLILHRDGTTSDKGLTAFINELRPKSLESFATASYDCFSPQCFQALSCHSESLIELKLNMLQRCTIPKVSLLNRCTNLVSLSLGRTR